MIDLTAIRAVGEAHRAHTPELMPEIEDLRRALDPRWARRIDIADDIRAGRRDDYGRTYAAAVRAENRGRGGIPRYQCWSCHRIGTVRSAVDTCRRCGYEHGGMNFHAVSVS